MATRSPPKDGVIMTTKNDMLTALNNAVQAIRLAGAQYHGNNPERWELTTHNMGPSSGWSIVWRDTRGGGVSPIVHLGNTKKDVARRAWDIVAVSDAIRMGRN